MREFVQFCPCGHTRYMSEEEFVELAGSRRQLDAIDAGKKFDAPILPTSACEQCQEEWEERERKLAMMLDWP